MKVVSLAMVAVPSTATIVRGNSRQRKQLRTPADASALRVSSLVSWNSGANVAGASGPYDDQPITQNQTMPIVMLENVPAEPP